MMSTLCTRKKKKKNVGVPGTPPPEPQIKFVIKVLFMTPNYVTIIITKFHTIYSGGLKGGGGFGGFSPPVE